MSVAEIQAAAAPLVTYFSSMIVAGVSVSVATNILKSNMIPIPAEQYPRLTAAALSVVGSVVAIYLSDSSPALNSWYDYAAFTVGVLIVSAVTYQALLKDRTAKK